MQFKARILSSACRPLSKCRAPWACGRRALRRGGRNSRDHVIGRAGDRIRFQNASPIGD